MKLVTITSKSHTFLFQNSACLQNEEALATLSGPLKSKAEAALLRRVAKLVFVGTALYVFARLLLGLSHIRSIAKHPKLTVNALNISFVSCNISQTIVDCKRTGAEKTTQMPAVSVPREESFSDGTSK